MSIPTLLPRNDYLAQKANNSDLFYTGLDGVNLELDQQLITGLACSIFIILVIVLSLRTWHLVASHLRHIYCLTANRAQQNYWAFDRSTTWPWLKKQLIYAPLGRKRHNRELQLSRAHNYGTLPGRIHTLLLFLYLVGNIIFCTLLDYEQPRPALYAELRGRTGILATVNLVPLVLMAARNNPLIPFLKISFDTFNLFHRWIGRIIIMEAVLHVIAWSQAYALAKGTAARNNAFNGDLFLSWGLLAVVCMSVISLQSLSPIRHAFYETFLSIHQLMAFFTMLGIYVHLEIPRLPALQYIQLALCLWMLDRAMRFGRLIYLNHARNAPMTRVVIRAMPGAASRVTFHLPRHVTIRPGSHVYVYIPSIALWQSHPFSVAWTNADSVPETGMGYMPKTPKTPAALERQMAAPTFSASKDPTTVSLVCAARSGFTRKIYDMAKASVTGRVEVTGYIEGPYAGHDSLASYGTAFLFAAGAGITHHLVQTRYLLECAQARTVATKKIVLVWTVRDPEAFGWINDWMNEILAMPGRRDILKIYLYVTRPKNREEFSTLNKTLNTIPGRCSPGAVLDKELPHRIGASMVSVCGPGAFADEVRAAVRERIHLATLDMNEEAFTW